MIGTKTSLLYNLLWVGAGGFIGSAGRYLLGSWIHRIIPLANIPVGTLVVNAVGCLLMGLLAGWGDSRQVFSPAVRLFLLVGLLGGFTTFSSFAYETMIVSNDGAFQRGLINIGLQLAIGFSAVWIGYFLTRGS